LADACTLPAACQFVKQVATFLGTPNVLVAAGTYTTADINNDQCHVSGNAGGSSSLLTSITGDTVTPSNVVIAIQNGQNGFVVEDGAEAGIHGFEITNVNGGGPGIQCRQNCIIDYSSIYWGAWGNSGGHVSAYGNAVTVNPGSETLLSGTTFVYHFDSSQRAIILPGGTTTIQSGVSWSGNFAQGNVGDFDTTGWTVSGTGTGRQFSGSGDGYLNDSAACASIFPGTGGCLFSGGYRDAFGGGAPELIDSFAPGQLSAVTNTKGGFTKWVNASTVDNIEGSASAFTCSGNPTLTFYECGTSTTCASSPTTIGSVTVTAAGTVVDGTVSSAAIAAGDYTAWEISAGTCTGLDIIGKAQIHSN
jgi:hypothetical protein